MTNLSESEDLDEAATAKASAQAAARHLDAILAAKDADEETKAAVKGFRSLLRKKWSDLKGKPAEDGSGPSAAPGEASEAQIDDYQALALEEAEAGRFHIRVIGPGWGSSGYYSPQVLETAGKAGVFGKGLKMYWDHPTKSESRERPERSLKDLAGVLEADATWDAHGREGPGLYAPIQPTAQYRDHVRDLAPHIGVSIRGDGTARMGEAEGRKGRIIEAITAAKSVDFVTAPGAGGKVLELFEAARNPQNHQEEDDMSDLEEVRRDLEAERAKNTKLAKSLEEAQRDRDQALVAVAAIEAKGLAQEQLSSVKLPDATKARIIETVASQVPLDDDGQVDRKAVKAAVEEQAKAEAAYLAKVLGKGSIQGLGESTTTDDGGQDDPKSLEEAQKDLDRMFTRMGLGEKERVHAVNGR